MTNSSAQPRSPHAQLRAMAEQWPDFGGTKRPDGTLVWIGRLRPKAQFYKVSIIWKPSAMPLPYVMVNDPTLQPRPGGTFAEVPHLIFFKEKPEYSGLCLFDPDGGEWSASDLIATTTVPWTAEWVAYYELWHLTGEWLAPSVGYESVAQIYAAEARAAKELLDNVR